jgi:predicted transcriptional regulator
MTEPNWAVMTIRLPEEMKEWLRRVAFNERRSQNSIVLEAIDQWSMQQARRLGTEDHDS